MQALQFQATGSLDHLSFADLPMPVPAEGEVLVRVEAAGLNPSDMKNVLGRFPYTTLPRVPGRDFAGVVEQGPAQLLGKAVWGTGRGPGFTRDGSHARYLTVPAQGVTPMPQSLTFAQAASLGVPYTTAWDALERAQVQAGTRLLIIGANGAVGQAALALARLRGAQVLAAVRRPEQATSLHARGIDTLVLGDHEQLRMQVEAVYPGGAQVVFDTTGFWLPAAVDALAPFGRIALIAAPADGTVQLPALSLYRRGGELIGVNSLLYDTIGCAAMLHSFTEAFDQGHLPRPEAPCQIPLAEGVISYRALEAGSTEKVVLIPS
ncbi:MULTISPECIES: zinc-binding alcohol dehydrogenase family protein [unclassified Pseudomonas]|uniref:quinone oxidoreductase family protein n=1 Tax=unclassified Pseudomonas TaxID=196821 RepID=UPI000BC42FCD|nr:MULTISPECIES: zinc-binding alcohol dehydrogenase family protein [unclassified Pseudomonas]PVZ19514.1 NADPH:quinone reductase-like Zn-dependent oxidoreductase [Pseudomonas sp. URIL14HWK12:I12]PVZ22901.1 NADPH:quinone reductase-like Zn-dependent oxidoreductase [Pseudomonas sp. URIL14HWK12:I10]PVZ37469.1 NADPH:quinone reductase-like Zn-dependent oxidoreductase [Pseudomonas sp. URIL14HWK12:I11]SNZ14869.1 NADPH:quinone reductase [Pseudomonas sp. URIL14HWK12:I9]